MPLSLLPKVPFQPRFRLGLGLGLGLDYGAPPFLILTLIRPNRSHLLAYRDIVITSLLLTSLCLAASMGTSAIASFPTAALIGSGAGAIAVAALLRPVPRPPPRWRDNDGCVPANRRVPPTIRLLPQLSWRICGYTGLGLLGRKSPYSPFAAWLRHWRSFFLPSFLPAVYVAFACKFLPKRRGCYWSRSHFPLRPAQ